MSGEKGNVKRLREEVPEANKRQRGSTLDMVEKLTALITACSQTLRDVLTDADIDKLVQYRVKEEYSDWTDTHPHCFPKQVTQVLDDCWSISSSRQWYFEMKRHGRKITKQNRLSARRIRDDIVPLACQTGSRGVRDLSLVLPHLRNHLKNIFLHRQDPNNLQDFETLLERLFAKGSFTVQIYSYPSYFADGRLARGLLFPTPTEIESTGLVDYVSHSLILCGKGVDRATGKRFWKLYESQGTKYGHCGFVKLARDMGLVFCAIEMELPDPTRESESESVEMESESPTQPSPGLAAVEEFDSEAQEQAQVQEQSDSDSDSDSEEQSGSDSEEQSVQSDSDSEEKSD